jgi:hypothetical protein
MHPTNVQRSLDEGTTLRLQIVRPGRTVEGTCFLIASQRRGHEVVLSFLTSARLFRATGGRGCDGRQLRLVADGGIQIETTRTTVLLPPEQAPDVAIVRVTLPYTDFVPFPVASACPEVARAFVAFGHRENGAPVTLKARVRRRSPWFIVGDRTIPDSDALVGAPALVGGAVFGLVSDCGPDRCPTITALTTAYSFIARHVPGWIRPHPTPDLVAGIEGVEYPPPTPSSFVDSNVHVA